MISGAWPLESLPSAGYRSAPVVIRTRPAVGEVADMAPQRASAASGSGVFDVQRMVRNDDIAMRMAAGAHRLK
jgi:hypothetical protein